VLVEVVLVVLVETLELKAVIAVFLLSHALAAALGEMLMIFKKHFQTVDLVEEPLVAQVDVEVLEQQAKDMKVVPQMILAEDSLQAAVVAEQVHEE
jgi:hypothetical protein